MELTKNELAIADRYLSKRERRLAQWSYMRWLALAIIVLFMFRGYQTASDGMRSIRDEKTIDSFVSASIGEAPPPGKEPLWAVGAQLKVAKLLELHQQEIAYAVLEVGLGYLEAVLGVALVCVIVLRSKTFERDVLICKLLRAKLQELQVNEGRKADR